MADKRRGNVRWGLGNINSLVNSKQTLAVQRVPRGLVLGKGSELEEGTNMKEGILARKETVKKEVGTTQLEIGMETS